MKKNFTLFLLGFFIITQAQQKKDVNQLRRVPFFPIQKNNSTPQNRQYERCSSVEYENYLRSIDPNRMTEQQFESWLAPLIEKTERDRANNRNINTVYNIPVVIHIIHDGDCYGQGENITDAQAISQITVMNQDYRKMSGTRGGTNSTGLAQDVEINFILAKRDPNNNPSTGVVRHQITPYNNNVADTDGADWETTADVEAMKQATIWDPTKYLNMWIIRAGGNTLATGGLSDLLGYAQFPQGSTLTGITAGAVANTDGVVCVYNAMGTADLDDGTFDLNDTYNLGRTMTHEVGHWLGLRHIWGDNTLCPSTNTDNDKDYCSDTPAANAANYDCNLAANSCTSNPGNDQVQNYMDYTNDACMDTFTTKQKTRMQTCMANALRRSTLNSSNGTVAPSAGVYFNYTKGYCTFTESTNCGYTDVNYKLSIIKAPTANTLVTFNVDPSSTATNNLDYQVMTPTLTFGAGLTNDQFLTIRYFNDGIQESSEFLKINFTVNANGGDGSKIDSNSEMIINVLDNDVAPTVAYNNVAIDETFDNSTVVLSGIKDLDGDTFNWGIGAANSTTSGIGISGNFAISRSWTSTDGPLTPDNILFTSLPITIPNNATLSFKAGTTQTGPYYLEHYSVYLTTVNPTTLTTASLNAITPVINNSVLAGAAQQNTISTSVSTYAGQNVYLIFRHHNTNDMNMLIIDDVNISSSGTTQVQTEVNSSTKYQALANQSGNYYAKDMSSGNVILDAAVNAFNYGCTSVEVNRSITSAGASAVNYGSNTAANLKVMAKTILVTPATASSTGNVTLKFYFTEAEIAAWETATGNNRSALKVFKAGESTTYTTTIGSFGSHVTLTATTTTGFGGTYYFGISQTLLSSDTFDLLNDVMIYPNPANNIVNIRVSKGQELNGKYEIYNNLGQKITTKLVTSENDLSFNVSNYSNGVYFVNVTLGGLNKTFKFIKN